MRRSECLAEPRRGVTYTDIDPSYIVPGLGDFGDRFYTL
jgi:hypothetical protein